MIHKGFIDIIDPQHVTKTDNNSFSVASTTHSIPHQNMSISKDMIIIESILLRVETDSLLNGKRIEFNTGNVVDILYGGEMQSYIVVNISQVNTRKCEGNMPWNWLIYVLHIMYKLHSSIICDIVILVVIIIYFLE